MHALVRKFLGWHFLSVSVAILVGGLVCQAAFADDDRSKSESARVSSKTSAPTELTERERLLLERVEQLEKRVAKLEGKRNAPGTRTEVVPSTAVEPAISAPPVVAAAQPASSNVVVASSPATLPPSDKTKPKAEPFAFADFT